MEVELHQLLLRYERLRKCHPRGERALLASLAEIGQQVPVVVVGDAERFVLIDGYKRVRALRRLARDVVLATRWELRIPVMTDSCSGDDGHHRSEATQAGGLLYRLSAMVPRGIGLAHRFR